MRQKAMTQDHETPGLALPCVGSELGRLWVCVRVGAGGHGVWDRRYQATAVVATPAPSAIDADLIRGYCVMKVVQAVDLSERGATTYEEQIDQVREGLGVELDEHAGRIVISVSWRDPGTAAMVANQVAGAFVEERNRAEQLAVLASYKGPTLSEVEAAERSAKAAQRTAVRWLAEHEPGLLPEPLRAMMSDEAAFCVDRGTVWIVVANGSKRP